MVELFRTIRQTAAVGILNEHRLRKMHKEGKLPGIYSGNRFLVDQSALEQLLHNEAIKNCESE